MKNSKEKNIIQDLIDKIRLKKDSIPTNTIEQRRVRGAYVDCIVMAEEILKTEKTSPTLVFNPENCPISPIDFKNAKFFANHEDAIKYVEEQQKQEREKIKQNEQQ